MSKEFDMFPKTCYLHNLSYFPLQAATPAGKAWVLRPRNERSLRVRRLKPCPRNASACNGR